MKRSTSLVYAGLIVGWGVIAGWQVLEHNKVVDHAKEALVVRGRDITGVISRTLRAQYDTLEPPERNRTWQVPREWVQAALDEIISWRGVVSLELLNREGAAVARAPLEAVADVRRVFREENAGEASSAVPPLWDDAKQTVSIFNLQDLRPQSVQGEPGANPVVIRPNVQPRQPAPGETPMDGANRDGAPPNLSGGPDRGNDFGGPGGRGRGGGRGSTMFFGRPPWYTWQQWQEALQQSEVHAFLIVLSTDSVMTAASEDRTRRVIVSGFALAAAVAMGLAWRFANRTGELQLRLVRTSEMNTHLREMNLAAAGLAHETRNPLNIIRGLAQMISKSSEGEIRTRSREITEEVDRVSAQLNEFINYSKPREVRRAPVQLNRVIADVLRALKTDIEDKKIALHRAEEDLTVEADQAMLRQVLFNLLINAIHFVGEGGEIEVATAKHGANFAYFEVRDNGPGVPAENRESIFQPYFTTRTNGTGLGLAVVKQIIDAHGWDIQCLPNASKGTVFRISRVSVLGESKAREKRT